MHILFVDDTLETRTLFRLNFTLDGHTADTACDGVEALQIIEQKASSLDVIIMDYHMPQMDGLEVMRLLRKGKKGLQVPVILFTGDTAETLDYQARELGVACVLRKPLLPSQLLTVAQKIINQA